VLYRRRLSSLKYFYFWISYISLPESRKKVITFRDIFMFDVIISMSNNLLFQNNFIKCCSCRWGETVSLNCDHQRTCCLPPRFYMNMESHHGMILTGKTEELGEKPVPVPLCPP
jgi:hypothetical protein